MTAAGHATQERLRATGEQRLTDLLECWQPDQHPDLARFIDRLAREFFVDDSALRGRIQAPAHGTGGGLRVTLLAVPNVSEGRDRAAIAAIAAAFSGEREPAGAATTGDGSEDRGYRSPQGRVRLLDTHSDADHHRTVFTLAGPPAALGDALLRGARAALGRIELGRRTAAEIGQHPHVGAVDVVPIVYLDRGMRGAARAEALVVADRIGEELGVPVFLYGALADGRSRAELRRGGVARLAERMRLRRAATGLRAARRPHPGAGATLVAARAPLVAFNLQLAAPASVEDARRIAAFVREGGAEGLPGLRAIGVELERRGRAGVDERRASLGAAAGGGCGGRAPPRRGRERGAGRARAARGVRRLP